jgi:hypothetical protein
MEKRITREVKKEGLLIKINAFRDESKQKTLTIWLLAWSFCGIAIGSQLFVDEQKELRTMLFVFLAFWAYFEFKVVKAFRWRRGGEEQIWITEEVFHYGRTFNQRGILKPYRRDLVNQVRSIDEDESGWVKAFLDSYWVIGGERLAFSVNGKLIPFGLRLSDSEKSNLMKLLNKEIEKKV